SIQVVKQEPFISERDVSDAAKPRSGILMLEAKRDGQLDLISGAEAPLVYNLVRHARGAFGVDGGRENGFVFRKGLVGDQGAWQIQFAARPAVAAETAHVLDNFLDLVRLQRLGERGHDFGEPSGRSAVVDNRFPI